MPSTCFVCTGNGSIWMLDSDGVVSPGAELDYSEPSDITTPTDGEWLKLPHMQSWAIDADVDDPDEFVTSDTGGTAVKPCPGVTSYTVDTNFKVCQQNWVYAYLLQTPGAGDWLNPNAGKQAWFFLSWEQSGPTDPGTPQLYDRGVYLIGQVNPSGLGLDNNAGTASETEPPIEVTLGPFLPPAASFTAGTGPRPLADPP